jgi:hypothetical protein
VKYFLARRVRADRRREGGVGACGGQPGSGAKEGRSLLIDSRANAEPAQMGAARVHDTNKEEGNCDGWSGVEWGQR